jgi:hypothetical protein
MITAKQILERIDNQTGDYKNELQPMGPSNSGDATFEIFDYVKQEWGTSLAKTSWIETSDEVLQDKFDDLRSRFVLSVRTLPSDNLRHEDERYTIHLKTAGESRPDTLSNDYLLNEPAFESLDDVLSRFEELSIAAETQGSVGIGFPNERSKNLKPTWLDPGRLGTTE